MSIKNKLRDVVKAVPDVRHYLSGKARFALYIPEEYKTQEFMLGQIRRLVTSLYNNQIGGDFIDVMANVISGQLRDAYTQAWESYGETTALPDYLSAAYETDVLRQYEHVDQYFRDIIDARLDGKPIDPLIARADLWAQRWTESYNNAIALIESTNGGRMEWVLGATEQHCPLCSRYNGIVAFATEWQALNIAPQNAPNHALTGHIDGEKGCEGWRCDCSLTPTDKRRSPNAYGKLEDILQSK